MIEWEIPYSLHLFETDTSLADFTCAPFTGYKYAHPPLPHVTDDTKKLIKDA